jgi:4,4'-diaponeurosporenoate glycosyltransferase
MTALVLVVVLTTAMIGAHWALSDLRTLPRSGGHHEPGPGSGQARGAVSVVIPARNEADTLPTLLGSLQRSTLAPRDIVVVDDGSRDATPAVAASAGANVLNPGVPPPGWTGKAWACHVGARAASGDLLLFLDADTALSPDALGDLRKVYDRHGGLVSVQPFHGVVRSYEQLSAYFNAVAVMASGAFTRRPGGRPMAFGPCLLTSRAAYEQAGGHAAVRAEILDDVQLAVAYDRAGLPVRCFVGGQSIRMRSYPGGIRQLAGGWTKNVASGASAAPAAATLAAVAWVSVHHAVAVGAIVALVEAVTGRGASLTHGPAALWALAWVVAAWQLRSILRRIGSFQWWAWLLFPVPLLAFDVLFARSAALTAVRRSVRWRGRDVNLRRRGSAEGGV